MDPTAVLYRVKYFVFPLPKADGLEDDRVVQAKAVDGDVAVTRQKRTLQGWLTRKTRSRRWSTGSWCVVDSLGS